MANSAQAKKRIRQAVKHQQHNVSLRSLTRTHLKKTVKAVAEGNKQAASDAYKVAVPILDKMVNKGIIHKNKAARHKSRLNKHLKTMASAPAVEPKTKAKGKTKAHVEISVADTSSATPASDGNSAAE